MQYQMFIMPEVGIIRRNEPHTLDMFGAIFGAVEQLGKAFCETIGMALSIMGSPSP
jgi:hypothetical protein